MAAKFKRHLKKEIVAGKAELPDELKFLSRFNYFAVAEQRVQGVREWYVEINGSLLKTLLDTKKKLNAARLSNRTIKSDNQTLQDEIIALKNHLKEATATNAHLKETIKEKVKIEAVKAQELQREVSSLKKKVAARTNDVTSLNNEMEPLRQANIRLLENRKEDARPDRFQKSPKNFFNSVEESGINPVGLPLQGGSAGTIKS